MRIIPNFIEPCVCGNALDIVTVEKLWRFIALKCPNCGRECAQTLFTDAPHAELCANKRLLVESNRKLREEKGLPPRRTVCRIVDDDGQQVTWGKIDRDNKRWAKRVGARPI